MLDFIHTITIYNKVINPTTKKESYNEKILNNVFWYDSNGLKLSGKGIEESDTINVIIPLKSLNKYKSNSEYDNLSFEDKKEYFTIRKNERIVKGEYGTIASVNELNGLDDVMVVNSITKNLFGSDLDCILIGGK